MMSSASDWRFYAYRPVSGEWLDTDVQLKDCSLTYGLSTINTGAITLPIPDTEPKGSDGRPVWGRWDTIFMAERNGVLDWCGLADSVAPGPAGTTVTLVGLSAWLSRVDYSGVYSVWETNTFDVLRELIDHANSKPRGLTFTRPNTLMSATTVGDPEPPAKPHKPGRHKHETKSAYHSSTRYTDWQTAISDWNSNYQQNQKFKILWWEAPYVGKVFNDLASETGFDWREKYSWAGTLDPEFRINFADDLSATRTDFAIIEGVNVVGRLATNDDDLGYANKVIMRGAGHGRKMLRKTATYDDGRLYATRYARKKHQKHRNQLQRAANQLVKRTRVIDPQIGTVSVYDVEGMAPAESLKPGDIITVRSDYTVPRVNVQCLVRSKTENPLQPGVVQVELETQAT